MSNEQGHPAVKLVSEIVAEQAGIQLGEKQASMVESRLKSRLLRLGLDDLDSYLKYLTKHKESESQALVGLLTTHHTYFFREFSHFEFLLNKGLDRLIALARSRPDKTIRVWSAACSRGQEVYSLAMFFDFHLKHSAPDVRLEITGTDVDPESVAFASNGVYKSDEVKQSPAMYMGAHWILGSGSAQGYSKAKDSLRKYCKFEVANLNSLDSYLSGKKFDLIFCRNVFIYFDAPKIAEISKKMMQILPPEGLLFLGISESLNGLSLPVQTIGPSVYQHPVAQTKEVKVPKVIQASLPIPEKRTKPLEVLCVDDSPTILAMLKKILVPEHGFVVKATANNGRKGIELLKSQSFDLITLDLHMPELDGLGFLQEAGKNRPPVIILSSINREDKSIAQKAIQLGASDYVEKPSLERMAQASNEIRAKLKVVFDLSEAKKAGASLPPPVALKQASPALQKTEPLPKAASPAQKPVPKSEPSKLARAEKKKVLIVDDSATIRQLLKGILSKDPELEVVGECELPSQVEASIRKLKPDVITLDINMPEMDGVTLLKKIHPLFHIPVVMISAISKEEGPQVLQALESGAVDYIQKPALNELDEAAIRIREQIKVAAKAKAKRAKVSKGTSIRAGEGADMETLVVIGASTGGTEALRVVLESLPAEIPPILIVQHIPPVFSAAFAKRLNELCKFPVVEAKDGDQVTAGKVYIAPGGFQMAVKHDSGKLRLQVNEDAPVNRHKPSVDYLFSSVAKLGSKKLVAAILTGMGADGANGMKSLRSQGARTIAQNEETSVVFGMPREAIAKGGAEFILPLTEIAQKIWDLSVSLKKRSAA